MARKDTRSLMTALLFGAAACIAAPAQAQLAGFWQFEGDFTDSSANGNDGAQVNGVTFTASQAGFGQAADFDGNNTHVLVPHDISLDITGAGTFAAWVNADGNSWEGILAKSPSNGSSNNQAGNYELRLIGGTEQMSFLYQRGGLNDTATVSGNASTAVPTGTWQHVAVTVDGTGATETVNFYLNGTLVQTITSLTNGFGATNTNPLYIGSRADLFTDFHGQLDDVAIYNNQLDAGEIRVLQTGVLPNRITGVTASASSELGGFNRVAAHVTNNSGIDATVGSHSNAANATMWLNLTSDLDPTITFDLGEVHNQLDVIQVWNYNENSGNPNLFTQRGVNETRILISEDGVGYTALINPDTATDVWTLDKADGNNSVDFSQLIELGLTGVDVRYVQFDIISSHTGDNFDTNTIVAEGYTGLSEVRIYGSVIPEPSSLALIGLGGLLIARRRR